MNDIVIRKMTLGDVDALCKIETDCFSAPWSKNDFLIIPTLNYAHFYVLEYQGKAVAFAGIYALDVAELMNIAVLPEYRGKHFACALLDECINKANELKVPKMLLEVRKSNTSAIALYEKYQFKNIGIRKNYYTAPIEDAIIMVKELNDENSCI
jgi:ribosomal-protein-alanine N-acetyltransferase